MSQIDLHIHTCASADGEYSAAEILALCVKKQMKLISITDHNSVRSVGEALAEGRRHRIEVIPGIEIDCVFQDTDFHLLGYGFDFHRPEFHALEEDILRQERNAAEEKIEKFRVETGIPLSCEEVFHLAENGIVTGELIAEIVLSREDAYQYKPLRPYLEGGARSDMPYVNLYWDYFARGKPAYVPIRYMTLQDAQDMIRQNHGWSVLAHPGQTLKKNRSLIDPVLRLGLEGLEAFSSYHSSDDISFYYDKATEYDIAVTCGSDFHGKTKPQISLGDCGLTISEESLRASWQGTFLKSQEDTNDKGISKS